MIRYLLFPCFLSFFLISFIGCKPEAKFVLSEHMKKGSTLGLPQLEVPSDNPITKDKVLLGEKLFKEV